MGRQSWGAATAFARDRDGWRKFLDGLKIQGALWGMKFFNAREKSEHEVRGGRGGGVGEARKGC